MEEALGKAREGVAYARDGAACVAKEVKKAVTPAEGGPSPMREVIGVVVSAVTEVEMHAQAMGSFAAGVAKDSKAFLEQDVGRPVANLGKEHPEVVPLGTAALVALSRVRRGPVSMVKGGALGFALGAGFLYVELVNK